MAKKGTKIETLIRARKLGEIIARGGRRSDCIEYGSKNWGVGYKSVDKYLEIARAEMKADWDMERPQMVANLLSQAATLQMEARRAGQFNIALGAINTAAKLAHLVS